MIDEDTNLMNKYRLNYFCLTNQINKTQAKEEFCNLAEKFYPEKKKEIMEFKEKYNMSLSGEERIMQTV